MLLRITKIIRKHSKSANLRQGRPCTLMSAVIVCYEFLHCNSCSAVCPTTYPF